MENYLILQVSMELRNRAWQESNGGYSIISFCRLSIHQLVGQVTEKYIVPAKITAAIGLETISDSICS